MDTILADWARSRKKASLGLVTEISLRSDSGGMVFGEQGDRAYRQPAATGSKAREAFVPSTSSAPEEHPPLPAGTLLDGSGHEPKGQLDTRGNPDMIKRLGQLPQS